MINVVLVAPTPQEAYAIATEKYGGDFVLVSAKQIQNRDEEESSCEITISVSKERFLELIDIDEEEDLQEELSLLRDQISQMEEDMKTYYSSKEETLIEKVKSLFIGKGIAKEWLDVVLEPLIGSTVAEDENLLVAYLLDEIDETLEIREEDLSKPKVMMFVGPTGVGKTTTVAKLAARYAYMMDESHQVALVNLDSFRVGAFEQLAHFADIMKLKHVTASSVDEFGEVYSKLKGYDVILIDTAGMSPFDTQKLINTVEYLSLDHTQNIEVNLVISSTVKYEDIKDIHDTFSFLNLNSVILSKFDETKYLGAILSYLLLNPVPISYFSIGQEVPDDLVVASREYLLQKFIGDLDA